jgi:hypothetical protein
MPIPQLSGRNFREFITLDEKSNKIFLLHRSIKFTWTSY